ncbi:DUF6461 domain-containing protein [Actinoplanes auranticolor]|uniref:Uncharacterized protein n=1 Tax=Actinoplanes auranticolor TaxID=47988 RepID=A0A919SCT2_9ACTN|nr:DUF6461 domain-containing protein [Actinoplanes auranticolor]GIM68219.1 hypothetical protein Aau02nite_30680 [Actinoplanes auranticolor]
MDDLAHARVLRDQLGPTFCLTYVKDADAATALRRLGGCPDTIRERTPAEVTGQRQSAEAGFAQVAVALELGAWSVVIEPGGILGADHGLLEVASRGSAAVSVLRHDDAAAHFGYAVDGTTIVGFDPGYPAEETVWGADPGMLRHLMDALGLRTPTDEYEPTWQDAEARAIVLAQRITGARLPDQPLSAARISAELEPWFVTPAAAGDLLRAGRRTPHAAELVTAAEAAAPQLQRSVAVAEVRRQAAVLGLADTPGLMSAITSAGAVTPDSPLGKQVREWLAAGRRAAGDSGLSRFLAALRGVRDADPQVALLAALKPYASGLPGLADEQARTAVLAALRDQAR